jgi:Mg-chelatase subunit ChlD
MFKKIFHFLVKSILGGSKSLPSSEGTKNCIMVLDVSPSMSTSDWKPSRLAGAKQSASAFVRQLMADDPNARVAVVKYSTTASVVVPLTPARYFEDIEHRINHISTGFMTNITSGLKIAHNMCSRLNAINHVILLSDGCHNVGRNPKNISDKLKKHATIECVGIGGSPKDVDEQLMKYIASSRPDGTKRYRWIGQKETLVKHFQSLATGLVRASS